MRRFGPFSFHTGVFFLVLAITQPGYASLMDRIRNTCDQLLKRAPVSFRIKAETTTTPASVAVAGLSSSAPELRDVRFTSLDELFLAFSNGLTPNIEDSDQLKAFQAYLATWLGKGTSTNYSVSESSIAEMAMAVQAHPGVLQQPRFRDFMVQFGVAKPTPVPELLRQATNRLLRQAKSRFQQMMNVEVNIGDYRKILLQSDADADVLVPKSLRERLKNEKIEAQTRAAELFKFLYAQYEAHQESGQPTQALAQTLIDLMHVQAFLSSPLQTLLKSEFSHLRVIGLKRALQARDGFALNQGFEGHFNGALKALKTSGPRGVERPSEIDDLIKKGESDIYETDLDVEATSTATVRQLFPLEKPHRSCLGGSDCSSDTYFTYGFERFMQYFTMTYPDGRSMGHATVILGVIPDQKGRLQLAAQLDKLQNVSWGAMLPLLEAVRQGLDEFGFSFWVPLDPGSHESGLTNDSSLADAYINLIGQIEEGSIIRDDFKLSEQGFGFENFYSQIDKHLRVIPFRLPRGKKVEITPGQIVTPWQVKNTGFLELVEATIKLRNGSWEEKSQYLKLMPMLEELNLASSDEHKQMTSKWLKTPDAPLRFKGDLLLQELNAERYTRVDFDDISLFLDALDHFTKDERLSLAARLAHKPHRLVWGAKTPALLALLHPATLKKITEKWNWFTASQFANLILKKRRKELSKQILEIVLQNSLRGFSNDNRELFLTRILQCGSIEACISEILLSPTIPIEAKAWFLKDLTLIPERTTDRIESVLDQVSSKEYERALVKKILMADDRVAKVFYEAETRSFEGGYCFVAGTAVDTPVGPRPIESLRPGDLVHSFDLTTRERVVDHIKHRVDSKVLRQVESLSFSNGQQLTLTKEHPFYSVTRSQFVTAEDLGVGEQVLFWDAGRQRAVSLVSRQQVPGLVSVYNFHTEVYHNYFAEGILVHNIKEIY